MIYAKAVLVGLVTAAIAYVAFFLAIAFKVYRQTAASGGLSAIAGGSNDLAIPVLVLFVLGALAYFYVSGNAALPCSLR